MQHLASRGKSCRLSLYKNIKTSGSRRPIVSLGNWNRLERMYSTSKLISRYLFRGEFARRRLQSVLNSKLLYSVSSILSRTNLIWKHCTVRKCYWLKLLLIYMYLLYWIYCICIIVVMTYQWYRVWKLCLSIDIDNDFSFKKKTKYGFPNACLASYWCSTIILAILSLNIMYYCLKSTYNRYVSQ